MPAGKIASGKKPETRWHVAQYSNNHIRLCLCAFPIVMFVVPMPYVGALGTTAATVLLLLDDEYQY